MAWPVSSVARFFSAARRVDTSKADLTAAEARFPGHGEPGARCGEPAEKDERRGELRVDQGQHGVKSTAVPEPPTKRTGTAKAPPPKSMRSVVATPSADRMLTSVVSASGLLCSKAPLTPAGFVSAPGVKRLKIAFATESYYGSEPDPDVKAACEATAQLCRSLGHEIIEAKNPINGHEFIDQFMAVWSSVPANLVQVAKGLKKKPEDVLKAQIDTMSVMMTILVISTSLLLAGFSIPTDVKNLTIHTIVTKPVERFEIVLGRALGYIALETIVLAAMAPLAPRVGT